MAVTAVRLTLLPITLADANAFVSTHHRHNKAARGCRFALAAVLDGVVQGVVIVGRPTSRETQRQEPLAAEVTRCCARPGAQKGTCSFLYAAARRVWLSMGGHRIRTYTLQSEGGESLRGAGWEQEAELRARRPASWQNRGGARQHQAVVAEPKIRWGTGA
jgi:hypothetical protein